MPTSPWYCWGFQKVLYHHSYHVGASVISLAPTFLQKSERAHSAAPPFQSGPALLGSGLVFVNGNHKFCIATRTIARASVISLALMIFYWIGIAPSYVWTFYAFRRFCFIGRKTLPFPFSPSAPYSKRNPVRMLFSILLPVHFLIYFKYLLFFNKF